MKWIPEILLLAGAVCAATFPIFMIRGLLFLERITKAHERIATASERDTELLKEIADYAEEVALGGSSTTTFVVDVDGEMSSYYEAFEYLDGEVTRLMAKSVHSVNDVVLRDEKQPPRIARTVIYTPF